MSKTRINRQYDRGEHGGVLAHALLQWFALHQRDLPWRRSRDAYRIWVSEVMLQQTRVGTVIPYYERWFELFPTLSSLAEAPEDQVLKAWEGLGYYSRARNLHGAVKEVVAKYGGEVPDDPERLGRLKGLGPYTVGAVLSIAYNRALPAVDGNVQRVLSRLYRITDDIMHPATRQGMEALAADLIPVGQASAFNQALMELGALVCTPTSPKCAACPVSTHCRAHSAGVAEELPVKAKAKAPRAVDVATTVIWQDRKVLITRRPSEGLLGGLWEFPSVEKPVGASWERTLHTWIRDSYDVALVVEGHLTDVRHVFSHLVWNLKAYMCHVESGDVVIPENENRRWVLLDELKRFALPVAHQKIARALITCSTADGRLQ